MHSSLPKKRVFRRIRHSKASRHEQTCKGDGAHFNHVRVRDR